MPSNPPLAPDDAQLLRAAQEIIEARFRPGWHAVGAALRLRDGRIVTGVHLEAFVGRIAVCAEAIALGRAVTEFGSSAVHTVVAVQHPGRDTAFEEIPIVSPCGMCRELLLDYSPDVFVLLPGPERVPLRTLLPAKYGS